jgi:hypothetical protein
MAVDNSPEKSDSPLILQHEEQERFVLSNDDAPVGLWAMSDKWQYWHHEVCSQLNINSSRSLQAQLLSRPWFLVPFRKPELTDERATDLLETIAEYLIPSETVSVRQIRERLASLTPDTSLPFLYAMRYIGYARARQHRYWPEFRKALFNNKLTYGEVAIGLADSATTLWLRLHWYTGRALYYPTEGSTNIKWPLVHAGLHTDDKKVLKAFGLSLHFEGAGLLAHYADAELDEFIEKFRDWLQGDGQHRVSTVAEQLLRSDDETYLRAELAQQWLKLQRPELVNDAGNTAPILNRRMTLRRILSYQSSTNEIGMTFSPGQASRIQQLSLDWNKHTVLFTATTIPSSGERVFLTRFVPVDHQKWAPRAIVRMNATEDVFSLPAIEDNETLVFDTDTGERTKRWQFDHTYNLLISKSRFKPKQADELFAQWYELNPPRGDWSSYQFVWARTVRMPSVESTSTDGLSAARQLQKLEEDASEMGLPSLGHYYQPRGRLVGQPLPLYSDSSVPAYSISDPPIIELQGLWNHDVSVTLKRRDSQSGQLHIEAYLLVSSALAGQNPLIEIWQTQPVAGTFAILIDQEQIDFCLVGQKALGTDIQMVPLAIDGCFAMEDGSEVQSASRHAYDELVLVVRAWPSATLSLILHQSSFHHHEEFTIQLNEQGTWSTLLTNLPINWSGIPKEDLSIQLSWRGLFFSQRLELEDRYHVSANSLVVDSEKRGWGQFYIHCIGQLRGTQGVTSVSGMLLPNPPWSNEPRTFVLDVTPDGVFEGSTLVSWQPQWIMIVRRNESIGTIMELLTVQPIDHALTEFTHIAIDLRGIASQRISQHWRTVAPMIASIAHPTDLRRFLAVEPLLSLMDEFNFDTIVGNRWSFATSWSDLQELQQAISQKSRFVFLLQKPSVGDLSPPLICVEFEPVTEVKNVKEMHFRYCSPHTGFSGRLKQEEPGATTRFILQAQRTLRGCKKCQLLMPVEQYDGHISLSGQEQKCTAMNSTFIDYLPNSGYSDAVVIGIFADPRNRFDSVINDMRLILKEKARPSSVNQSLFEKLHICIPAKSAAIEWLQGLSVAMVSVTDIVFGNRQLTLQKVVECGRVMVGYEQALRIILQEIAPHSSTRDLVDTSRLGGN